MLIPVCHGLAFMSLQLAFQRGTALATAGVSTLPTNALPVIAGLAIFSEYTPGGPPGLLRGLGFAATALGAAMLASGGRTGSTSQENKTAEPMSPGSVPR